MTAKPHDALFKAAFEKPADAASLFRCALPEELGSLIDYDTFEPEPGSFIDPELADTHSDLLFSARLCGEPILLYLLLEHQSTNDSIMPLRMLEYLARISKRHYKDTQGLLPPIIPLVISHAPGGWTAPVSFHQLITPDPASLPGVAELVPSFKILVDDLARLSNEQLRSRALRAFQRLALWMLRDARDIDELLRNSVLWVDAVYEALRAPNGAESVGQLFRYIRLITNRLNYERFRDNMHKQLPPAQEATMFLTADEEYRHEARIEVVRQQLTLKFGELPNEYQRRLESASPAQLQRYTAQVLFAQTLAEVFAEPT